MRIQRVALAFLIVGLCLVLATGTAFSAGQLQGEAEHPKLDSVTQQLLKIYQNDGVEAAAAFAQQHHVRLAAGQVQVTVRAQPDRPQVEAVRAAILAAGGEIEAGWGIQIQARVPLQGLEKLAASPEVQSIRQPLRAEPDVTTEGDAAINANDYRAVTGSSGAGVKVAILDSGFSGYPSLQASGELPASATAISFRADGVINGVTVHGAACAEIVYDLAPGATYYFVNYETDTEFMQAVDYLEAQGVKVVSHSVSWFNAGPYDGTSEISERIATAKANGLVWVNSAGNRGQQHWEGNFNGNASNYHLWSGSTVVNELGSLSSGTVVTAYLSWNDWPAGTSDYDLELVRRVDSTTWTVAAYSRTRQTGAQPPSEAIAVSVSSSGTYGLRVVKYADTGGTKFLDLFTTRQNLQYRVSTGSVPNAGDSAGALTVGAVDVSKYNVTGLESFSSRGPTNATGGGAPNYAGGSRTKPDISGPDYVSTVTYGTTGFGGTSSSTPHTAGAAVLYISGYLNSYGTLPTPAQTQTYLENCAEEQYDWGTDTDGIKNNDFGAGGLYLCRTPTAVGLRSLVARSRPGGVQSVALSALLGLLLVAGGVLVRRR